MNLLLLKNIIFIGYAPNVSTNLLWWLTYLFAAIGILYFAFSFFFKEKFKFSASFKSIKQKELAPMVSHFLFMEENATNKEMQEYLNLKIKIRELIKTKRNRKVLASVLVELRRDLSGESLQVLFGLYRNLDLEKDAYAKLSNWKWHTISQGINELTVMEVEGSYRRVAKFINDRRSIIRKQAELAILTLDDDGIIYFLDTTKKNISEWQQLKILDILINKPNFVPPSFKNWLISKNIDTVLFCIRLIKHFNQFEAAPEICTLIRHKNPTIRAEAVQCAKEFRLTQASEVLKSIFLSSTDDCKLLILDALDLFDDPENLEFLQLVGGSKDAFAIKNKASVAVNSISPYTDINPKYLENGSEDYMIQLLNNQEDLDYEIYSSENKKTDNIDTLLKNNKIDFPSRKIQASLIDEETNLPQELFEDLAFELNLEQESDTINASHSESLSNALKPEEESTNVPIDNEKHLEYMAFLDEKIKKEKEPISDLIVDEVPFKDVFFDKSHYEKFNLLNEIEKSGDKLEIPLLQAIIDNENNENIKNKAISLLEKITSNVTFKEDENIDDDIIEDTLAKAIIFPTQTVFKDLYDSCDVEAKLILLEEIGNLADVIELQFLKEELSANQEEIRIKAAKTIAVIENRLGVNNQNIDEYSVIKKSTPLKEVDVNLEKSLSFEEEMVFDKLIQSDSGEPVTNNKPDQQGTLIPLEFCFLLDELEIKHSKPSKELDLNFEISNDYFLSTNTKD